MVIYLTLFLSVSQKQAQGTNLLFYLASTAVCLAVWILKKQISFKEWLTLAVPAVATSALAGTLARGLPNGGLQKGFACLLLFLGGKEFFSMWKERKKQEK